VTTVPLTAPRAANRVSKIVAAYSAAHQLDRFPVDVTRIALDAHNIFGWSDAITRIESATIQGFEGCLVPNGDKTAWMILYNSSIRSAGRIRFTQGHELGHYILHRTLRDELKCTEADMVTWSKDEVDLEGQADQFASYLLMPLDDYRKQANGEANIDAFLSCADRYGVSLTAAILKWLDYTTEKAVLVYSTDGFMNWAWSSEPAFKAGAFFKTRGQPVPIPTGSLAANEQVREDRLGIRIAATTWFPHAERDMHALEMKFVAERLGVVISIIKLPSHANVWPRRPGD
jgi:hypothetical protein